MRNWLGAAFVVLLATAVPALAQQSGSISGKVTSADGEPLPGVTIEATSNVLPQARQTVSAANGEYRLPLLPPGSYEVTFTLEGMVSQKKSVLVALQQSSFVDVTLSVEALSEAIEVVAQSSLIDTTSAELKSAITADTIEALPVGQEYRDLVKLIPGVQYTEDNVRGPSAGGSGQDNTYLFDGVNVTLPQYGTLSTQPASHDIDQVAIVKGGANAIDFNRAGGFLINTISRSGTNEFRGMASYQVQPESLTADRDNSTGAVFEEDKDWAVANFGGPIFRDHLYFYASYYAPTRTRESRANNYGAVPDYESDRDEYFGKLTFAPTDSLLFHGSYRSSDTTERGNSVSSASTAGSASSGGESSLEMAILEASWVIDQNSYASFRFNDFANPGATVPDSYFGLGIRLDGSVDLDIANLDTEGQLTVPSLRTGETAYNAFVAPYINRYGFDRNGVKTGGGTVGGYFQVDADDFYRQSYQLGYDRMVGTKIIHELHAGYQWYVDEEDLERTSNYWGDITIPGGRINCPANSTCAGQPIYFQAQVLQQGIVLQNGIDVPIIHTEYKVQNLELNDSIRFSSWTLNMGLLVSNDVFYGQGLRENPNTLSGYELARGHMYKMHEIDWSDALQPRLGAVWAYSGPNTVYANYARYLPAVSSLPRAASWARDSLGAVNAYFDRDGNFIGSTPEASSSGKLFQEDIDPRTTDEYVIGTTRELGSGWTARAHARYRYGDNFWEDTNNTARVRYLPPAGIPRELYVPNLAAQVAQIGSGSSYVIAELDGAFTKYWETGLEAEWRGSKAYFRGSYVWSHYYGTFDQDNSSTAADNDANRFVGSSNIADGAGRQMWDFKYGNLRGDRRHQLKVFGYYQLPWHASVGAFGIYQSGQPWQTNDVEVYRALLTATGSTSTNDTNRYAEPAGSHNTDAHHQLDLNYTQDFPIGDRFNIQARLDVFNVYDNQTGYNVQDNFHTANFGKPQTLYDPRRIQIALRFEF
jgi:hypothetical protein